MAYQRSTQATGFKNRVAPSEEKQYTQLAKALKSNQVTDVKGLIGQGAEQIGEMKRLSGLEAAEDTYELNQLRSLSKSIDTALTSAVKNVIKPVTDGQIQDGINTAVRAGQGDEEAQAKVKLNDLQELELQRQVAEQREKVNNSTENIGRTWDEEGYEASLEQKYRLQNLKKLNSNFAIGFRRGLLMEAATGWDAFRDSVLTGSSDSDLQERVIIHEGTEYKVSDYYNLATPTDAKEKIVAALQNSYITKHGAGLGSFMVNKYLTNPVVERTNLFNQKEFNRSQLEWADDQINYHKDQFENFHFNDLESDTGKETAQLGVQEWINTGGSIMAATNLSTSRNAAAKGKLIEFIVDTLKSDKFKNMDDSEDLLSFLEEDRFYIPGISKKKIDGTFELSSLETLMGSDLSTANLRSELLQAVYDESRKEIAGKKIQLTEQLSNIYAQHGDDAVALGIAVSQVQQSDDYYAKPWANTIFKQFDSEYVMTPRLSIEDSKARMEYLGRIYDTKNGGVIQIDAINVQRVDHSVLKEYEEAGLIGDIYKGNQTARNIHSTATASLKKIAEDIFKKRDIGDASKESQVTAFTGWVAGKMQSTALSYQKLTNSSLADAFSYAEEYWSTRLKSSNTDVFPKFEGLSPALAEGDTTSLTVGDEGWSSTEFYGNPSEGLSSETALGVSFKNTLQKAGDLVSNNDGFIFKDNLIVKNQAFYKLVNGRYQPIWDKLSKIDPLKTHPAVLYNQQAQLLGGDDAVVEWPDKIQAEIEEWESLTVDSRAALISNDEVRFNTALKKEGYISLNDFSQTLVSPDGEIPIKDSEFAELVKRTGYNEAITYEEFLNNPVLIDKTLKLKMKDGLKLIEGTTNNESVILRKLTAFMMTGDPEKYNAGDMGNFTLEALNAYHSGNNSRLNTFFKKNGIKPNLKVNTTFDYSEIDTQQTVITAPLANNVADLELQLSEWEKLEEPEMKIVTGLANPNFDEGGMPVGPVSRTLRRLLGRNRTYAINPEYLKWKNKGDEIQNKIKIMKVLEAPNDSKFIDGLENIGLFTQGLNSNTVLNSVFIPNVKKVIGEERLNILRERANQVVNNGESLNYEDALFTLLRREPEFSTTNNIVNEQVTLPQRFIDSYAIGGRFNGKIRPEHLTNVSGFLNKTHENLYDKGGFRAVQPDGMESSDGNIYLRIDAAPDFQRFFNDAADNNIFIGINDGYRTYKDQANAKSTGDVRPAGESNHGAGISLDINYTDEGYKWIKANYKKYNLCPHKNIEAASPNSTDPEAWHWTWSPTGNCSEAINER
tara:strand:+ start:4039 stop:7899 length:3861 start_codon:yes stop_codon:yes gene_type:complete